MRDSTITATVDFEADGIQHGHLKLPHSHDGSAWGAIMIPVAVVKNGEGPTALLTGANHGDEYEGPVALLDLARSLDPGALRGRVIVVPMMNYPAFRAGRRTSPIDRGNLNRAFPGRPDGTVTEKIADYFQRTLLPMADVVLDIHAGGKTLDFVPFAAAHLLDDKAQQARCVAAMEAFNAPYSMMLKEIVSAGMYDTAAEALGKVFVSTELGGGGSSTARSAAIAKRGVANLLRHAGVLTSAGAGEPETGPSQHLDMPSDDCFLTSETSGLLEMCIDLGETVDEGQVLARVHDVDRTGTEPIAYRARIGGLLAGRHFPGLIAPGDCLAVVAVPK
jgi:N-alpha-acetyl-L-2,4-diaminobutyrate deacetylase